MGSVVDTSSLVVEFTWSRDVVDTSRMGEPEPDPSTRDKVRESGESWGSSRTTHGSPCCSYPKSNAPLVFWAQMSSNKAYLNK